MKLIIKDAITDATLDVANVPEAQPPEPQEWLTATAFAQDDECSVVLGTDAATITHGVYKAVQATTGDDPTIDDGTNWVFVRSTNRWAMFNEILQDQTELAFDEQNGLDLPGGAGNYANSPNIVGIFSSGKFTLFAKFTPDDATPASPEVIFSKFLTAGDQRSVAIQVNSDGRLKLIVSSLGTAASEISYTSVDISGLVAATEGWVQIEFDGDDGVNSSATFSWSLSTVDNELLVDDWTQMGSPVLGAQTSIFDSSAVFELGSTNVGTANLAGSIQQVTVYDDIDPDNWDVIVSYDRVDPVTGGTSTSLRTGQVWTEQGTAVFTEHTAGIIVQVTPGSIRNSLAFMNVVATEIQVIVDDPTDGEVFNETFDMLSYGGASPWYGWLFTPIERNINLVVFDLPAYTDATITVFINSSATAKCGAYVIGDQFIVGTTVYGAGFGIRNYSIKETDPDTGAVTISSGIFKDVGDYEVAVDATRFTTVLNRLRELRDVATVWVGKDDIGGTIIYGYYNDFELIYETFPQVVCQLSIEGLS